jgi:hypothetical protein
VAATPAKHAPHPNRPPARSPRPGRGRGSDGGSNAGSSITDHRSQPIEYAPRKTKPLGFLHRTRTGSLLLGALRMQVSLQDACLASHVPKMPHLAGSSSGSARRIPSFRALQLDPKHTEREPAILFSLDAKHISYTSEPEFKLQ